MIKTTCAFRLRSSVGVVVGLALATLAFGIAATPALATPYQFACYNVPANTWCSGVYSRTYGYVNTHLQGYPSNTQKCSKLIKPDNSVIYARKCANTDEVYVYSNGGGLAPYPNNSVSMQALGANGNNFEPFNVQVYSEY